MNLSLRARLLIVVVVLTAGVTFAVDTVTYLSLRSFLVRRVDQQLDAAHRPLVRALARRGPERIRGLGDFAPGLYVEVRRPDGSVVDRASLRRPDQEPVVLDLPATLEVPDTVARGTPDDEAIVATVTGGDRSGGQRYRIATWRLGRAGGSLTLALPLSDVESTLRRLLVVEVVVTGAALAGGLVLARTLLSLGLRPLDDIAKTAGAIAAGDLTQRVARQDEGTEIGRLGSALNTMLGQIERGFTERRASEERLRRFVADASHELRTPLTSIRAYAELFERGADSRPEDLARVLRGIETEAARMGVLVDDLLLLARLDQGRPLERAPVDLGALAGEAVDAARAVDPDRPLSLDVEGSVEVEGDRTRLRQIIDNLLANVREHTAVGTAARVTVTSDERTALLTVADDGPGIPDEHRARIFERFYRGDPSRARDAGGTGLGLAIVAAIAEAHGGAASVAADAGSGATFIVRLPLLGGRDTGSGAPAGAGAEFAGRPQPAHSRSSAGGDRMGP